MEKNVFVVFSDYPFGSNRTAEKLRMALGLTLNGGNRINLLFLAGARHALEKLDEKAVGMKSLFKSLEMLSAMKAVFHVESGGDFEFADGIVCSKALPSDIGRLLDTADVVIN